MPIFIRYYRYYYGKQILINYWTKIIVKTSIEILLTGDVVC